jgi:hypothetical protein
MTNAQLTPAPADGLAAAPGTGDAYLLEQVGFTRRQLLALGTGTYQVVNDWAGPAAAAEPAAATIIYFDGPLSPAAFDAGQRAALDRIQPALRDQPGLVRTITLWDPAARAVAVVNLAESLAALESATRVINSTTLLPDEDPALLPGPDRGDAHRVLAIRKGQS